MTCGRRPALPGTLSDRQVEILRLAANGHPNAEIARMLFLSEDAVKSHMQVAYRALGARDRANAVAVALVRGLIRPHEVELRSPRPPVRAAKRVANTA